MNTEYKKRTTKIISVLLVIIMVLSSALFYSYAKDEKPEDKPAAPEQKTGLAALLDEAEAQKEETVYIIADAEGQPKQIIVSNWLKNPGNKKKIKDKSILDKIQNVEGKEEYTMDKDNMMVWNADGKDVYYEGTTSRQLPVDLKISYKLDGKEISPKKLAGKSGRVSIKFDYENNEFQNVKIDGQNQKIYVPFAMLTGTVLDNTHFRNIKVDNGKIVNDGDKTVVAGFALPGLQHNLNLNPADAKIPSSFEISADVKDFEIATTVTIATNQLFNMVNSSAMDSLDGVEDKLNQLEDATNQLLDGTSQLYSSVIQLIEEGNEPLKAGAAQLDGGISTLYKTLLDNINGALKSALGDMVKAGALVDNNGKKLGEKDIQIYPEDIDLSKVTGSEVDATQIPKLARIEEALDNLLTNKEARNKLIVGKADEVITDEAINNAKDTLINKIIPATDTAFEAKKMELIGQGVDTVLTKADKNYNPKDEESFKKAKEALVDKAIGMVVPKTDEEFDKKKTELIGKGLDTVLKKADENYDPKNEESFKAAKAAMINTAITKLVPENPEYNEKRTEIVNKAIDEALKKGTKGAYDPEKDTSITFDQAKKAMINGLVDDTLVPPENSDPAKWNGKTYNQIMQELVNKMLPVEEKPATELAEVIVPGTDQASYEKFMATVMKEMFPGRSEYNKAVDKAINTVIPEDNALFKRNGTEYTAVLKDGNPATKADRTADPAKYGKFKTMYEWKEIEMMETMRDVIKKLKPAITMLPATGPISQGGLMNGALGKPGIKDKVGEGYDKLVAEYGTEEEIKTILDTVLPRDPKNPNSIATEEYNEFIKGERSGFFASGSGYKKDTKNDTWQNMTKQVADLLNKTVNGKIDDIDVDQIKAMAIAKITDETGKISVEKLDEIGKNIPGYSKDWSADQKFQAVKKAMITKVVTEKFPKDKDKFVADLVNKNFPDNAKIQAMIDGMITQEFVDTNVKPMVKPIVTATVEQKSIQVRMKADVDKVIADNVKSKIVKRLVVPVVNKKLQAMFDDPASAAAMIANTTTVKDMTADEVKHIINGSGALDKVTADTVIKAITENEKFKAVTPEWVVEKIMAQKITLKVGETTIDKTIAEISYDDVMGIVNGKVTSTVNGLDGAKIKETAKAKITGVVDKKVASLDRQKVLESVAKKISTNLQNADVRKEITRRVSDELYRKLRDFDIDKVDFEALLEKASGNEMVAEMTSRDNAIKTVKAVIDVKIGDYNNVKKMAMTKGAELTGNEGKFSREGMKKLLVQKLTDKDSNAKMKRIVNAYIESKDLTRDNAVKLVEGKVLGFELDKAKNITVENITKEQLASMIENNKMFQRETDRDKIAGLLTEKANEVTAKYNSRENTIKAIEAVKPVKEFNRTKAVGLLKGKAMDVLAPYATREDVINQVAGIKPVKEFNRDKAIGLIKEKTKNINKKFVMEQLAKALDSEEVNAKIDEKINGIKTDVLPKADAGVRSLMGALKMLDDGAGQLKEGSATLCDYMYQLRDGCKMLNDGMNMFNDQAISKIIGAYKGKVQPLATRLQATIDVSHSYDNYSGKEDGVKGSVKFIYRTDGIAPEKTSKKAS